LLFPIYPLTKNIPRAIQKPVKVYFYDNADCENDPAIRLENLVATHLLKRLQFREDYFGERCSLHYIRDRDDREVDFVTIIDGKVMDLIEVKLQDTEIASSLKYYQQLLKPQQTVQIVGKLARPFEQNGIQVTNPIEFFKNPPWEDIFDE
jgi:predicted AAA+ superfamily ATPase